MLKGLGKKDLGFIVKIKVEQKTLSNMLKNMLVKEEFKI